MTLCCCAHRIDALARSQARRLAAIVRREGIEGADVLDVIQDAFSTLLGRADFEALRDRPDDAANLLAAIARNAARNARRKHHRAKRHEPIEEIEEIEELDGLATTWTPAEAVSQAERTVQLAGCMQRLKDLHRSVVTLRVLEELSGAETAAQLGLTVGHVAVLLHRARAELESCMLAG